MQVHLSSGGYDIIASGNAFVFGEAEELTISITGEHDFDITVVLRFLEDGSGRCKVETEPAEDRLILSCCNFGGHGTGLRHPTRIAEVNGKGVFLMFWTYQEGVKEPKARSVKYTVFCET